MLVDPNGPLVGKSIEGAGLRQLTNLYLAEIDRGGRVMPAVDPSELLNAGDTLVFIGVVESVVELQRIRGLSPATNQVFKLDVPRTRRILIEAVVSDTFPLLNRTIREGRFRSRYDAVVIAVARNGTRLNQKIGNIRLRPGDTLLLEAGGSFTEQQRNSKDFFLVSAIEDSTPPHFERIFVALGILLAMVVVAALGWLSMFHAALAAAALMLMTRCLRSSAARRSIDWSVLIVVAAAFGLGNALQVSGAAQAIAEGLMNAADGSPFLALVVIYFATVLFSSVITNNAAAVLMFPLAMELAKDMDVSIMPFVVTIMMAASASFATPVGYQTNLMVYGPGGYRFGDYLLIGIPLNIINAAVAIGLIPLIWTF
jgi:di/tricarboxylate transporter